MPFVDAYPLTKPKKPIQVELQHHCERAIQYEFYIPAAVWSHSAVKEFREFLKTKLNNGARIFKTAVGVWKGDEEDTNIYRLIVRPKETQAGQDPDPADHRQMILDAIEKMMAHLAEWKESRARPITRALMRKPHDAGSYSRS